MKILVVQESDWLERNPHQQHHLMDRMDARGHQIKVIDYPIDWPKDTENKGLKFNREVHNNVCKVNPHTNITVIRPSFIKIKGLNYASLYFSHKSEIEKQIKEFQPDVIVGLGLLNSYTASKLAKKYNIPFVYYLIDNLYALIPEKIFQGLGKQVFQKALKNSDLVITINQKLSELAISLGAKPNETILIDAGIDFNNYNPDLDDTNIRKEYNILPDDIVLFFMGFIYDFAGMKELAKKLGENKEQYPKMKILIVGDGDAYEELLKIQKDYALEDQLILTGRQPYTKIPEFLASADFCLLPAYIHEEIMQDIVPIKLYEYLAMRKVVIATKLPGINKEFGENNGIVYVESADEVLNCAQEILNNGTYEDMAQSGREYVKSNDWEAIVDKFENTLNNLIEKF
ncbi:MAG: glycosyltransferase [Methanobacteriaceae archaeon]|nr:glycosyltransferase [Methanobacteriaceae archaeon]